MPFPLSSVVNQFVVTSEWFNQNIITSLNQLKVPARAVSNPDAGSNWTTNSTSYVDVGTDFNLAITPVISSGTCSLLAVFTLAVQPSSTGTGRGYAFDITLDGVSVGGGEPIASGRGINTDEHQVTVMAVIPAVSTGAHTVKLRWKAENTDSSVTIYAGTSMRARPRAFVQEF